MPKNFKFKDLTETRPDIKARLEGMGAEGVKLYEMGECFIIVSTKEHNRLHLSISTPYRLPTWHEVKSARYKLMPENMTVVMVLPPPSEYVNLHEFCFHLWETTDDLMGKI